MKNVIISLLILSGLQTVNASEKTYQTAMTCEQSDGDLWYSVGLVSTGYASGGIGLNLIIVLNNTDDGSKKLIADVPVSSKTRGKHKIYSDALSAIELIVTTKGKDLIAFFSLLDDGPNSIQNLQLDCYKNSEITFDSSIELEPRLSVGN